MARRPTGLPALWLGHVPNRWDLAVPSRGFQRALILYDKMLRLFPSQTDQVYRLVRLVRPEARMGLSAMTVHAHPDTKVCIAEGCVPVAALEPWAVQSPDRVIRDLRARDTWLHGGSDPDAVVDKLEALMDEGAARAQAARQAEADGQFDERASTAYRWLRYGPPAWSKAVAPAAPPVAALPPLPAFAPMSSTPTDGAHLPAAAD